MNEFNNIIQLFILFLKKFIFPNFVFFFYQKFKIYFFILQIFGAENK